MALEEEAKHHNGFARRASLQQSLGSKMTFSQKLMLDCEAREQQRLEEGFEMDDEVEDPVSPVVLSTPSLMKQLQSERPRGELPRQEGSSGPGRARDIKANMKLAQRCIKSLQPTQARISEQ